MNRSMRIFVLTLGILLLLGCDESTQQTAQNMGSILGAETQTDDGTQKEAEQFTSVVKGIDITFPADHQAHPDFRHEWWYLTANLIDEDGNALGLQWTQFRFAAAPQESGNGTKKTTWQSQ